MGVGPRRASSGTCRLVAGSFVLLNLWHVPDRLVAQPPSSHQRPVPDSAAVSEERRAELDAREERLRNDWAWLARYRDANAELGLPAAGEDRVVFMGNSITEGFAAHFERHFPGRPYVGRGIGGQTTPQMLVRFRQDVIELRPSVVVLLAGTNDIAGNTGPSTPEMIRWNVESMVELAEAHGIRVVLASVLPALAFPWSDVEAPAGRILEHNRWLAAYAEHKGLVYLDYHSAMRDERDGLRADLSDDGVHPNEAGFAVMAPLAGRAVQEALTAGKGRF